MRLTPKQRKDVNGKLHTLCRNRLPHIPLADINGFLAPHGLRVEEALLMGRDGQASMTLFAGAVEVSNSVLWLSWLKGDVTGTYEITAYLS